MINLPRFAWVSCFKCLGTFCLAVLFAADVPTVNAQSESEFAKRRKNMVEYAVRRAGVKDARKTHFRRFRVPVAAREAIVRVGLFGATGKASFDNIKIKKAE